MRNHLFNARPFYLLSVGTIVLLVLLWFVFTPGVIPALVFPSPESVWKVILTKRLGLLEDAGFTLLRVFSGWAIGIMMGILFGFLMTWKQTIFALSNPLIEAIRPLPPVALIPFFIIWFGISISAQIALIAVGCFMVMVVSTYVAVHNLPPIYIRAATSLGASKRQIYLTIIFPAILPSLLSGLRVAAALAFGVGVAAEFMGAQSGLGFMIMVARRTLNTDTILLGILLIGIESYIFDRGIWVTTRYLCRWKETPIKDIQK